MLKVKKAYKLITRRSPFWWSTIVMLTVLISYFHFTTPPEEGHIHLILMQFYLVPILIGAFQYGVVGGFGSALIISIIVAPHIIFQWVGSAQHHFLGYLQIAIFNAIGYLTGFKAQLERNARNRLIRTAEELTQTLERLEKQSEDMAELEEHLHQSERLSVIGELMASLAHELRNPLASIRGSVDILKKELGENVKEGEFFNILINETERMSGVVESYLALANHNKSTDVEYNAVEIIRSIGLILGSRARRDRIDIKMELPETPILILGDPNDLRQILVNLSLNAIQASENQNEICIKVAHKGDKIEISVQDDGAGIEEDKLREIFKPFYSTRAQGTGLGLSIVKRIANSRKWQIVAKRRDPVGSLFRLSIPLIQQIIPE